MSLEARALAALDPEALAADAAALVRIPSVTGDERAVMERFAALARARGLTVSEREYDLVALRAAPGRPGEEAPRTALHGVRATARGTAAGGPRLCLNGHLDVVAPGTEPWAHDPWSGLVEGAAPAGTGGAAATRGVLHGRGSVDMKGAVAAALHAAAAIAGAGGASGDVVVLAVAGEEDGGLGAFAALREDAAYAGAVVCEPTAFDVCCAQAGALTFAGVVPGVGAHAAMRLEGVSAIDRYVPVHAALRELERELNAGVAHPLMRELALPYPLSVGRVAAGGWSSSVPDRLEFEGRVGVPVGADPRTIRSRLEAAVHAACPEAAVTWTGGAFAPAETDPTSPLAVTARDATTEELGRPARSVGVTYGADMRLFCAHGIPTVMLGTPGIERAHAVDEHVAVDDLVTLARILIRVAARFAAEEAPTGIEPV